MKIICNNIKKINALLLIDIIIILLSQLLYIIFHNYPRELREDVMFKCAVDFSNGINPYSLDLLMSNVPFNQSVYGFIPALLLVPVIKIFGIKLIYCKITFYVLMLAGLFMFYLLFRIRGMSITLSLIGLLSYLPVYFFWHHRHYSPYPNTVALTFQAALLLMIFRDTKSKKLRPIVYAFVCVLMFYCKQYFIFISFPIFVFLLFKDLKSSVVFAVSGGIFFFSSIFIVNKFLPLYFSFAIGMAFLECPLSDTKYLITEFISLWKSEYAFIFLLAFSSLFSLFREYYIIIIKKRERSVFEFIKRNISLEFFILFLLFVPICHMSRNNGQFCEYFVQIIVPPVSIIALFEAEKILLKKEYVKIFANKICFMQIIALIFIGFFTLTASYYKLEMPFLDSKIRTKNDWLETCALLDTVDKNKMLIPPHLSFYCIENNIYCCDYGQNEYLNKEIYDKYKKSKVLTQCFPYLDKIFNICMKYTKDTQNAINNGEYDMILLTESGALLSEQNINCNNEYYELIEKKELKCGVNTWTTLFYEKTD